MNNLIAKIKESWQIYAITLMIGIVLGGAVIFAVKGSGFSAGGINPYPQKSSEVGGDWLVKIDDYAISKAEFDNGLQIYLSQLPAEYRGRENLFKKEYFDSLIGQYVITIKALNDGFLNDKENQLLIKTALRSVIQNYFIQKNAPKDPSAFMPSKLEIDQFNVQYSSQFDKLGYSADQRRQAAVQELQKRNFQKWAVDYMNQVKENYKIQRNNDELNKLGINAINNPSLVNPTTIGSN
jgi:hypothetical protein